MIFLIKDTRKTQDGRGDCLEAFVSILFFFLSRAMQLKLVGHHLRRAFFSKWFINREEKQKGGHNYDNDHQGFQRYFLSRDVFILSSRTQFLLLLSLRIWKMWIGLKRKKQKNHVIRKTIWKVYDICLVGNFRSVLAWPNRE